MWSKQAINCYFLFNFLIVKASIDCICTYVCTYIYVYKFRNHSHLAKKNKVWDGGKLNNRDIYIGKQFKKCSILVCNIFLWLFVS